MKKLVLSALLFTSAAIFAQDSTGVAKDHKNHKKENHKDHKEGKKENHKENKADKHENRQDKKENKKDK
jgi:Ni/Co efflux regulator RcnB